MSEVDWGERVVRQPFDVCLQKHEPTEGRTRLQCHECERERHDRGRASRDKIRSTCTGRSSTSGSCNRSGARGDKYFGDSAAKTLDASCWCSLVASSRLRDASSCINIGPCVILMIPGPRSRTRTYQRSMCRNRRSSRSHTLLWVCRDCNLFLQEF